MRVSELPPPPPGARAAPIRLRFGVLEGVVEDAARKIVCFSDYLK